VGWGLTVGLAASLVSGMACARDSEARSAEVWDRLSVAQARQLLEDIGAKPGKVEDKVNGDYSIQVNHGGDLPFTLTGFDCRGSGETKSCPRYEISASFSMESEAEAARLEHRVAMNWIVDSSDENGYLDVWRQFSLEGGVTRGHLKNELQGFVNALLNVVDIVYPPKSATGGPGAG
jgi:hypothetical protein